MAEAARRDRVDAAASREIAAVHRRLRATEGVHDVAARLDSSGARLYWDTWEPNPGLRGETLAGVCQALATSDHWELGTVHDPMERDSGMISSAVTVHREEDN